MGGPHKKSALSLLFTFPCRHLLTCHRRRFLFRRLTALPVGGFGDGDLGGPHPRTFHPPQT